MERVSKKMKVEKNCCGESLKFFQKCLGKTWRNTHKNEEENKEIFEIPLLAHLPTFSLRFLFENCSAAVAWVFVLQCFCWEIKSGLPSRKGSIVFHDGDGGACLIWLKPEQMEWKAWNVLEKFNRSKEFVSRDVDGRGFEVEKWWSTLIQSAVYHKSL